MDLSIVALLAVTGSIWLGIMGISAKVWLRKRELDAKRLDTQHLVETLEELREDMTQLRALQESQTAELHERMDFTERILTQGREPKPIESEEPTPV